MHRHTHFARDRCMGECMCASACSVSIPAPGVHVCHQVCVMQVRGILDANGKVGLGVDGSSSNETVNLMDDCRIATYLQRSGGNPKGVFSCSAQHSNAGACAPFFSSSVTACGSSQQGVLKSERASCSSGYVHTDCLCELSDRAPTPRGGSAPGGLRWHFNYVMHQTCCVLFNGL